ncbi:hypothetical protein BAC_A0074 (plasmid) [Bacillus anthracis str. A0488]|uniref:Uncharacterized protein n=1 Tax=Bacillus cereus (strain 03BB102) TaxID=572264 RepID=A0A125Y9U6_BACC3|nr:hypothetical protein BCA_A0155 [Bacillus cereus 03BB102]ACQ51115.1 hypothetical protein BAA_A0174 [Bacillus anthracis str. A0248]AHK41785.1 hypothetical protein BAPAT_pXO10167 [Bacillus anthracis str. SVA11]EDR16371.1 hypothetical protein BAC_A0074 [Bacillus anthracis str. A0488]EDR85316.1 hypothetical protein BAQ_A0171 [Bacillus anthracis str. A0193]EDR90528.1 hypothetical protein BAH_A0130 [Bacillus anthracis str. A0442]EDS94451.1 hypothetical protein BAK_A0074 [Bacillus anthracis str. A
MPLIYEEISKIFYILYFIVEMFTYKKGEIKYEYKKRIYKSN